MLFSTHQNDPVSCTFCERERHKDEKIIKLYGYSNSENPPVICDQCLSDCISKARKRDLIISKPTEELLCGFCNELIGEYGSYYTKGKSGICIECVGDMIKIVLEVNMEAGVKEF